MSDEKRYTSLGRALTLLADLIQGGSHERDSASKRLGLGLAAADRQLAALRRYVPGIVVSKENGKRTHRFDLSQSMPSVSLAGIVSAYFGLSLSQLFDGSEYSAGMKEILDLAMKRTRRGKLFQHGERKFYYLRQGGEFSLPERNENLKAIVDSILRNRILSIEYQNFKSVRKTFRVKPLSVVIYRHHLYLVGTGVEENKLEPFLYRFSRINSAIQNEEEFAYPSKAEYDPNQLFRDSFGVFTNTNANLENIDIQLAIHWKSYISSHRWHPSQKTTYTKEYIRVKFQVQICHELEAWILGFAEDAQVISPAHLRIKISARLLAATKAYQESNT